MTCAVAQAFRPANAQSRAGLRPRHIAGLKTALRPAPRSFESGAALRPDRESGRAFLMMLRFRAAQVDRYVVDVRVEELDRLFLFVGVEGEQVAQ